MRQVMGSVLYTDPQDQEPAGFCEECGGELYAPSCSCIRCGRDEP